MFQYMSGAKNVEGDNVLSLIEKREKVCYNGFKLYAYFWIQKDISISK